MTDPIEHLVRVGMPVGPLGRGGAAHRSRACASTPDEGRAVHAAPRARRASCRCPSRSSWRPRRPSSTAASPPRRPRALRAIALDARADDARGSPRERGRPARGRARARRAGPGARHRLARGARAARALARARWAAGPSSAASEPSARRSPPIAPEASRSWSCREAGRGGSAAVYEAEDRELGRRVALKVYHRPTAIAPSSSTRRASPWPSPGRASSASSTSIPDRGWLAMQWAPLGALASSQRASRSASALGGAARPGARARARRRVGPPRREAGQRPPPRARTRPMLADFGTARRARGAEPAREPGLRLSRAPRRPGERSRATTSTASAGSSTTCSTLCRAEVAEGIRRVLLARAGGRVHRSGRPAAPRWRGPRPAHPGSAPGHPTAGRTDERDGKTDVTFRRTHPCPPRTRTSSPTFASAPSRSASRRSSVASTPTRR